MIIVESQMRNFTAILWRIHVTFWRDDDVCFVLGPTVLVRIDRGVVYAGQINKDSLHWDFINLFIQQFILFRVCCREVSLYSRSIDNHMSKFYHLFFFHSVQKEKEKEEQRHSDSSIEDKVLHHTPKELTEEKRKSARRRE